MLQQILLRRVRLKRQWKVDCEVIFRILHHPSLQSLISFSCLEISFVPPFYQLSTLLLTRLGTRTFYHFSWSTQVFNFLVTFLPLLFLWVLLRRGCAKVSNFFYTFFLFPFFWGFFRSIPNLKISYRNNYLNSK